MTSMIVGRPWFATPLQIFLKTSMPTPTLLLDVNERLLDMSGPQSRGTGRTLVGGLVLMGP